MPETDKVEADRFFPVAHRFPPSSDGLAEAIEFLYAGSSGAQHLGEELREHVAAEVSEENFQRDTLSARAHFSRVARQTDR